MQQKFGNYTSNNKKLEDEFVLPQNASLLVSFGQNTFYTISNTNKLPRLENMIDVITQISHKRGKPNARAKGLNLMGVPGSNC